MLYRKNLSIEIRKGTLFVSISRYSDLHVNFTSKVPVLYLQREAIFPDNAYAKTNSGDKNIFEISHL